MIRTILLQINSSASNIFSFNSTDTSISIQHQLYHTEDLDVIPDPTTIDLIIAIEDLFDRDALNWIYHIKTKFPRIQIVLISIIDDERLISQAFKLGISAYLHRNSATEELGFAVEQIFKGYQYFSSSISLRMLNKFTDRDLYRSPKSQEDNSLDLSHFSEREIEVLNYIAEGKTNAEIAVLLFVSKRTIEGYRKSLIAKTGARNTAALIKYAILADLI